MQQTRRQYTLDDYFTMQRGIDLKLEYFNGEIYAMSGGTIGHNKISLNVTSLLHTSLSGSACEAFGSDMRVSTPSGLYTYPDASIVCGQELEDKAETITDPVVIIEVLSDSTRNYDRGEKFELYRSIPALRHYLLIEPSLRNVEHRHLDSNGSWSHEIYDSSDQIIHLSVPNADLPMAKVYEGVEADSTPPQG